MLKTFHTEKNIQELIAVNVIAMFKNFMLNVLHGKAKAKGDPLAPLCQDCHGNHNILPVKDHNSAVAPMKIPFLCGKCHREGTPVQLQRNIPQDRISRKLF